MQPFSVPKRWTVAEYLQTGLSFGVHHLLRRAPADIIDNLIDDEYEFLRTSRFQSDPIESRFSQYRQMSIGRFF